MIFWVSNLSVLAIKVDHLDFWCFNFILCFRSESNRRGDVVYEELQEPQHADSREHPLWEPRVTCFLYSVRCEVVCDGREWTPVQEGPHCRAQICEAGGPSMCYFIKGCGHVRGELLWRKSNGLQLNLLLLIELGLLIYTWTVYVLELLLVLLWSCGAVCHSIITLNMI